MEVEKLGDPCFFSGSSKRFNWRTTIPPILGGAYLVVGSIYGYGNSSQLLDRMGSQTTRAFFMMSNYIPLNIVFRFIDRGITGGWY